MLLQKNQQNLLQECYSHLFEIQCVGLRFFTVYGPWGRPDMATFIFTKSILENKTIPIFNYGKMERDFTYIDDIVQGILGALKKNINGHKVYNLGNSKPEVLLEFVELIEKTLKKKQKNYCQFNPAMFQKHMLI